MKFQKCKLTKLVNGSAIRTNEVDGYAADVPKIGCDFVMFADPIDEAAESRLIRTSTVKDYNRSGNVFTVTTLNSVYKIEFEAL